MKTFNDFCCALVERDQATRHWKVIFSILFNSVHRPRRAKRWDPSQGPGRSEGAGHLQPGGSMNIKNKFADSSIQFAPSDRQACRSKGAVSFLLISLLVLASCGKKEETGKAPAPLPVVVAAAIQKTVPIYAEFTAKADARDTVDLRARVEAFLEGV